MFCNKCGKEIVDDAVICIHCGCSVSNSKKVEEEDKISAGIVVLTLFFPIVGIAMGIINLSKKMNRSGTVYLAVAIGISLLTSVALIPLMFL